MTTPQDRLLGTVKAGKYLARVKGYPVPLVALAGGGQAGATLCDADINYVGTTAIANDSLMIAKSEVGREVTVINNGAQNAKIYGNTADTNSGSFLNGGAAVAGTTGIVLAPFTATVFYCVAVGVWATK